MASRVASSASASSSRVARVARRARRAASRTRRATTRRRAGARDDDDARATVEAALREGARVVADGPGCFALEDAAGTVVFVGGGRSARDALRRYAATTTRDVDETYVGAVEAMPKRTRSSAVRNKMREMLEALEHAPEDNAAAGGGGRRRRRRLRRPGDTRSRASTCARSSAMGTSSWMI